MGNNFENMNTYIFTLSMFLLALKTVVAVSMIKTCRGDGQNGLD